MQIYPYNKEYINGLAPESAGVYYLYGHSISPLVTNILYVGKSNNIRERLNQHVNNEEWVDIHSFSFLLFSSEFELMMFEKNEIERLRPIHNKDNNPTNRALNYLLGRSK